MRDYAKTIDRILERFMLEGMAFDDSVACYFFANLRQLIESKGIKHLYPIIDFYACWCLHPGLDRNNTSQNIIASIAARLPSGNQTDPTFIDIVCENLSVEKLREEISLLGQCCGFRNVVSDSDKWKTLYGVFLNLVTEKPLAPPINIPANSTSRIVPGANPLVELPSTIRLWLHGKRGRQAEWTIAIVPDGTIFDINNLANLLTFNGGVFSR